jgi:hypothetical protein
MPTQYCKFSVWESEYACVRFGGSENPVHHVGIKSGNASTICKINGL